MCVRCFSLKKSSLLRAHYVGFHHMNAPLYENELNINRFFSYKIWVSSWCKSQQTLVPRINSFLSFFLLPCHFRDTSSWIHTAACKEYESSSLKICLFWATVAAHGSFKKMNLHTMYIPRAFSKLTQWVTGNETMLMNHISILYISNTHPVQQN